MLPSDDRDRLILRRTLSAIAWLYAAWNLALGLPVAFATGGDMSAARPKAWWLVGHAVLFSLAGLGLWGGRRWAWPAAFTAAAASIVFVALDMRSGNLDAAVVDGAWPALAVAIFLMVRAPRA